MVAEDIIISCFLVSCFVLFCQALHKQGLANTDHTTLLLNCYTKLKDVSMLDEFIMVCAYRFISCEQALFSGGGRWYKECPLTHSPSPILFLHSRVTCSHTGQIIQRKKENFLLSDYRLVTTGPSYSPRVSFIDGFASSRALLIWKT